MRWTKSGIEQEKWIKEREGRVYKWEKDWKSNRRKEGDVIKIKQKKEIGKWESQKEGRRKKNMKKKKRII